MEPQAIMRRTVIFYGWWVVAVGFLAFMIVGGMGFYGFGAYFTPLVNEFGWTRTQVSAARAVSLAAMFFSPFIGAWVDRQGARRVMIIGTIIASSAFVLLSQTTSIWYFYVMYFVMSVGQMCLLNIPVLAVVSNWFSEKRGLAIGVTMTGAGAGGLLMVPLITYLISIFNWRGAYLISGLTLFTVLLPLTIFVLRNSPKEMGLLPNGKLGEAEHRETKAPSAEERDQQTGQRWTLAKTLKTPTFWLISGALLLALIGLGALTVHLIPFLIDNGLSAQTAAAVLASALGISILGRVTTGLLADRMGVKYVAMLFSLFETIGFLLLLLFLRTNAVGVLWPFVIIFGLGLGGLYTVGPLLVSHYFGTASFGVIFGTLMLFDGLALSLGPVLAGYIFDVSGNYVPAFIIFAAALLGAIVLFFLIQPARFRPE